MLAIMVQRHDPVTWIDHRFWYYPLPFQALVVFGLLWGLERVRRSRTGALPLAVPLGLAALVLAQRRAVAGAAAGHAVRPVVRATCSGAPPSSSARCAADHAEPALDGDYRRFYFECLDRFPVLAGPRRRAGRRGGRRRGGRAPGRAGRARGPGASRASSPAREDGGPLRPLRLGGPASGRRAPLPAGHAAPADRAGDEEPARTRAPSSSGCEVDLARGPERHPAPVGPAREDGPRGLEGRAGRLPPAASRWWSGPTSAPTARAFRGLQPSRPRRYTERRRSRCGAELPRTHDEGGGMPTARRSRTWTRLPWPSRRCGPVDRFLRRRRRLGLPPVRPSRSRRHRRPSAAPTPEPPVSRQLREAPPAAIPDPSKCQTEAPTFLADVEDAIRTAATGAAGDLLGRPDPERGRRYYVGLVRVLDRKGLCADFDGEELGVTNTRDYSDVFDVQTARDQVRQYYVGTCYPALVPHRSGVERTPPPAGCARSPRAGRSRAAGAGGPLPRRRDGRDRGARS